MRPKKRILLIDANEIRRSLRRFLLVNKGYAVISADSDAEARALNSGDLDLVICNHPLAGQSVRDLLNDLHRAHPHVPSMLLIANRNESASVAVADVILPATVCAEELVERVKFLCARKRGPRKKSVIADLLESAEARRA